MLVPKQRNTRDENAAIKAGETPDGWDDKPARRSQKGERPNAIGSREAANDARWTVKHGKSHYGYKNHVNVDRRHKLIRRYAVTDASVHDSQALDDLLDDENTASDIWAASRRLHAIACRPVDSAYRSAEIEETLAARGLKSRIHRKAHRNRPLTEREKQGNRTRSKVRARVEHVFGAQSNDMGGALLRCIGIVRARARIGLRNLAYNMRRVVQLDAAAAPCAPT